MRFLPIPTASGMNTDIDSLKVKEGVFRNMHNFRLDIGRNLIKINGYESLFNNFQFPEGVEIFKIERFEEMTTSVVSWWVFTSTGLWKWNDLLLIFELIFIDDISPFNRELSVLQYQNKIFIADKNNPPFYILPRDARYIGGTGDGTTISYSITTDVVSGIGLLIFTSGETLLNEYKFGLPPLSHQENEYRVVNYHANNNGDIMWSIGEGSVAGTTITDAQWTTYLFKGKEQLIKSKKMPEAFHLFDEEFFYGTPNMFNRDTLFLFDKSIFWVQNDVENNNVKVYQFFITDEAQELEFTQIYEGFDIKTPVSPVTFLDGISYINNTIDKLTVTLCNGRYLFVQYYSRIDADINSNYIVCDSELNEANVIHTDIFGFDLGQNLLFHRYDNGYTPIQFSDDAFVQYRLNDRYWKSVPFNDRFYRFAMEKTETLSPMNIGSSLRLHQSTVDALKSTASNVKIKAIPNEVEEDDFVIPTLYDTSLIIKNYMSYRKYYFNSVYASVEVWSEIRGSFQFKEGLPLMRQIFTDKSEAEEKDNITNKIIVDGKDVYVIKVFAVMEGIIAVKGKVRYAAQSGDKHKYAHAVVFRQAKIVAKITKNDQIIYSGDIYDTGINGNHTAILSSFNKQESNNGLNVFPDDYKFGPKIDRSGVHHYNITSFLIIVDAPAQEPEYDEYGQSSWNYWDDRINDNLVPSWYNNPLYLFLDQHRGNIENAIDIFINGELQDFYANNLTPDYQQGVNNYTSLNAPSRFIEKSDALYSYPSYDQDMIWYINAPPLFSLNIINRYSTMNYFELTAHISYITNMGETLLTKLQKNIVINHRGFEINFLTILNDLPYDITAIKVYFYEAGNLIGTDKIIIDNIQDFIIDPTKIYFEIPPIDTFFAGKSFMNNPYIMTLHLDRLELAGDKEFPDYLYSSQTLFPEVFSFGIHGSNPRPIEYNDNDNITTISSLYDRNYIWKKNKAYVIVGDILDGIILKLSDQYGCIAKNSVSLINNQFYFLSNYGFCRVRGNDVLLVSEGFVNNFLFKEDRFTRKDLEEGRAVFYGKRNQYRFYVKNFVIIYDLKLKTFYIEDDEKIGEDKNYTMVKQINQEEVEDRILFADSRGIIFQEDIGPLFYDKPRSCYLKFKEYKSGDFGLKTNFYFFGVDLLYLAPFNIYFNDKHFLIDSSNKNIKQRLKGVRADYVSLELKEESSKDFGIRMMGLYYD